MNLYNHCYINLIIKIRNNVAGTIEKTNIYILAFSIGYSSNLNCSSDLRP